MTYPKIMKAYRRKWAADRKLKDDLAKIRVNLAVAHIDEQNINTILMSMTTEIEELKRKGIKNVELDIDKLAKKDDGKKLPPGG